MPNEIFVRTQVVEVYEVQVKGGVPCVGFLEKESAESFYNEELHQPLSKPIKMLKIWNEEKVEWEFFHVGSKLDVFVTLEIREYKLCREGLSKLSEDEKEVLGLSFNSEGGNHVNS